MKIELLHQQNLFTFHETKVRRYAAWIMEQVRALRPEIDWQELSLIFTDDQIRSLNHQWFGKDRVTDVISFAYTDGDATGEVIVNVQQAFEEGRLRESPDQELALYIAHGCHHLMGAEDDQPDQKDAMLALETEWVTQALSQYQYGPFFK